ncbi:MAG: PAS domain-containing protein [Thermodesulfobacteriota bacterium]|nr:PAS domain-containing protein [Thermodesulfobacteriota bacterium]
MKKNDFYGIEDIFETIREPLLVLDANLNILSANRSFYSIFKVEQGKTIGHLIFDVGNKQWDIPALRTLLEDILPTHKRFDNYEVEHDFPAIGYKTMLLNARQIYREDVGTQMILLAIEDITERREIEKGLEKARKELEVTKISEDEAREYAESIINTVREPLIALDQDLRVVTASRSFYEVFRVTPEETVGQLIYDLGNKQWNIPKLRELLETILPEKTTFDNYEVEHEFSTIGRRIMLLNARQIQRVSGKERIILLAIEDITERKEIESGLENARKELEAFAYSVSHDLRAPLRAIDVFSRIVLEDYAEKLDDEGKRLLNIIRSNTQKMDQLIIDMLELSRASRTEMKLTRIDMTALVNSVYHELASPEIQQKFVFSVSALPDALGDPTLIRQVWINLISNAIKYTMPKEERRIEIGSRIENSMNAYSIKDTGVGYNPDYAHKLFGLFQRLHKAEVFEGTGVGLAIVKRVILRHGGNVWAEGKVNEGATFCFSIPIKEAHDDQSK